MVKERVLELANKISNTKKGKKGGITPDRPEYRILEPVVTDEMAEIGLHLKMRKPQTAAQIADYAQKPLDYTDRILRQLAWDGVCIINVIDGVDHFWLEPWVPGIMEMMVNNRENVEKYPQIAQAFEAYGRARAPLAVGIFPVGLGPMRVIPIEASISGETRKASYEEISMYLNENTLFSVSDCSCRTSREAMGEGCGHLKEEMCIQMGDAAKYYIRTGRAREITREEAFGIIKKAEDNGLMHCIPNLDGPGKTHAICNCCGCSCLALRNAGMFYNNDMVRSNYVSKVEKDKCVACGECVEICPVNALKLGQKLCSKTPRQKEERQIPFDTEWGPEKWNADYRTNKQVVEETGTSPCKSECPAHIGIQGYIKLASQGRYKEALELIKEENPFPAVCGRICPRLCETACTRRDLDEPLAIDDIKKFIADQDLNEAHRYIPRKKNQYDKKIAVVGGGPGGLTCAYFLAIEGYKVTVFEKEKNLGGMLTFGIPSYRLEKNVINAEIEVLKILGVQFKTGVEVGKDITINKLRKQGYAAFYLAIGAQGGRKIGIDGEDAKGVYAGVEFLKKVSLGEDSMLEGETVVIGGGNVAIDVARTAIRLSKNDVSLFCLEGRKNMPALQEEVEEALEEGIAIQNSWGPKRILVTDGCVAGVEFIKCISVLDKDGHFSPQYDPSQTMIVPAQNVLLSVGQSILWGNLLNETAVALNRNQTAKADAITFQTNEPDIFVGGDAYTGPRFAIDAIAQGKEGAISIHRFVNKGQSLVIGRVKREYKSFDKNDLVLESYDNIPRQKIAHISGQRSKETFQDLRTTFTEEQMKKETERCLSCGITVTDEYLCVGCGACVKRCKFEAIKLDRKYDAVNVELSELKPKIIKAAIKRKARIKVKKLKTAIKKTFS
ncbi:FAD-dependent oxidoreductase [Alkaliphilus peptidifermentans]|uniref:NADPH-dependent glutamate synthase beta chain n=1 Tax=Alkaliphilus peptidifermentans DSM 18978 TaxID=1120976 RepID=A0A1G5ESP5_9FIRM|nr:FAD-dependent oxidoreductase [Alkaliphilus peptidifermentans]SCY30016.1 NADPH-dependent glutamate synthase beta chain [Alkaliphilus peptidifermentans DSM 18978]